MSRKSLSPEQIRSIDSETAWEIAEYFGRYLENSKNALVFDNVLEYDRESILVALLFLLRQNAENTELVNALATSLSYLFVGFMPSPEDYEALLKQKELFDGMGH